MKPTDCLTAGLALSLATASLLPGNVAAKPRITKLELFHDNTHHRPVVPVVRLRFVAGQWRVQRGITHFDMRMRMNVNVGNDIRTVRITVPSDAPPSTNRRTVFNTGRPGGPRRIDVRSINFSLNRSQLGELGRRARRACATRSPLGLGVFLERSTVPVRIDAVLSRTAFSSVTRGAVRLVTFDAYCEGLPTPGRSASAPPAFRLTGAGIRLKSIGTGCPRTVFATAVVFANRPGKVSYVMRTSQGRKWTKTIFVNFQNARGVYEASFAHRLTVPRSRTETFWIEAGGRKIGRPSTLRVTCLADRPRGMTN